MSLMVGIESNQHIYCRNISKGFIKLTVGYISTMYYYYVYHLMPSNVTSTHLQHFSSALTPTFIGPFPAALTPSLTS